MDYEEVYEKVTSWTYVPLCAAGAPVHPQKWSAAEGVDFDAWKERQLRAYIKHYYHVEPVGG